MYSAICMKHSYQYKVKLQNREIVIFMIQRSSSDTITYSLNKKAIPMIQFSTTTRSACVDPATILCRASRFLCCRRRSSETIFVKKSLLRQRAKTMQLNTPARVMSTAGSMEKAATADGDTRGARRFTLQVKASTPPHSWKGRKGNPKVGAAKWWLNKKLGWDSRIQLCHFTPHEVFFSQAPPSLFFNSFPPPFLHTFLSLSSYRASQFVVTEVNSHLGCWRRSCARSVTECSRDGDLSHTCCTVTDSKPPRERRAVESKEWVQPHLLSAEVKD